MMQALATIQSVQGFRIRPDAAAASEPLPTVVATMFPHQSFFVAINQWIGLRENLQKSPIFNGKIYGFL
jgi:hypothetical protein